MIQILICYFQKIVNVQKLQLSYKSFHFPLMFTEEEQQQLTSIISKLSPEEFQVLRDHFANKALSSSKRSSFTPEEDAKLRKLVQQYGEKSWPQVASYMEGRTTRQCRERYRHYLSPNIINGDWTPEEDKLLIEKYNQLGPKWVSIAKVFKTRTDINVKNRWIVLMRKNASIKCPPLIVKPSKSKRTPSRQAYIIKNFNNTSLEHQNNAISGTQQLADSNTFDIEEFDTFVDWSIDQTVELI